MIPTNVWIVLLVGLIPLAVGAIWYGPLFKNAWLRVNGLTDADLAGASMVKIYGLAYVFSCLIALLLCMVVIHQFGLSGMFGMLSDQWLVEGSELTVALDGLDARFGMYTRHLSFGHGLLHGAFFGLAFVGPIVAIIGLFERRPWRYAAIHTGYWTVALGLMGGVLSQFLILPL